VAVESDSIKINDVSAMVEVHAMRNSHREVNVLNEHRQGNFQSTGIVAQFTEIRFLCLYSGYSKLLIILNTGHCGS
jgi:hypothetical protein